MPRPRLGRRTKVALKSMENCPGCSSGPAPGIFPGEQLEPLFRRGGLIRDSTYCALGLWCSGRPLEPAKPALGTAHYLKIGGLYKHKSVSTPGAAP